MASPLEFETPENVQIAYRPAGLGTRFSAWMLDTVFVLLVSIAVFVFAMVVASATGVAWKRFENLDPANEKDARQISLYFFAFAWLFWGLGSFLYFTLCELLGRGQTIGKRASRVRVVKSDGFSLDAASILLRNVFRLVDQLPAAVDRARAVTAQSAFRGHGRRDNRRQRGAGGLGRTADGPPETSGRREQVPF